MKFVSRITVITLAIAIVGGSGIAVAKSPHQGRPASLGEGKVPPSTVRPDQTSSIPKGYTVVNAGFSAPSDTQTHGGVLCPAGTVVWGGGVSYELHSERLNSSYPLTAAPGWAADVNNGTTEDSTFVVYAVCAKQPRNYAIVWNTVANPSGSQSSVTATCPGTSKSLGGGAYSDSLHPLVGINSTSPAKKAWVVRMDNPSPSDATATAYAVCGNAKGQTIVRGPLVTNRAFDVTFSSVACPAGQVPSGGGEFSNSGSTNVALNSTFPGDGWGSWEVNDTVSHYSTRSYVVCVGVA